jgi:WD40-like Beta Propeller Repeat
MRSVMLLVALGLGVSTVPEQSGPIYTRLYALNPREGVFAYARVSPDGRKLVYASQLPAHPGTPRMWTEVVVDLATKNILFTEAGIDAYWSSDGTRIIYSGNDGVTVRNVETGAKVVTREASGLGDYYSWATRDGRDLILTIDSNYYYLDHDKAVLPPTKVSSCAPIGTGERPLIAKDGRRITTFVKGNVVVRGLDNCDEIFDTGIQGAKADFSWDGNYIAFHALRSKGDGYEIKIVDVRQRTVRTLPVPGGSALFPSWTQDGRLCFRYDGPDYRGFMMASGVLDVPSVALPAAPQALPEERTWHEIFPETAAPEGLSLVMIWAPWSAHSREAFDELARAREYLAPRVPGLTVMAAADPGSAETDITRQLTDFHVTVPRVKLSGSGLLLTEARNQMPTVLLFRDGLLVDRRLGAQSSERLRDWVGSVAGLK